MVSRMIFASLLCIIALALSASLTGILRRYALKRQILDVPNARSSHSTPTPRGGGAAIVAAFLVGLLTLMAVRPAEWRLYTALLIGGLLIAGVGWLDDRKNLSAKVRLLVHFAAVGISVAVLGGVPRLDFHLFMLPEGLLVNVLGVVFLVWLINLYNFMDGIDGIAGSQAVFVGLFAGWMLWLGQGRELAELAWLCAAASAGFLRWNWPRAQIFMGDVSSGFLGFVFGILMLVSVQRGAMTVLPWLILLGVFLTDTTFTLLRRLLRGQRWYAAHRQHAYQHAAIGLKGHLPVTLAVIAINLAWLLPCAWLAWRWPGAAPVFTLAAFVPLIAMACWLGAGTEHGLGVVKEQKAVVAVPAESRVPERSLEETV
jgi:Fuc2NAc and GlcNAc transferase